MDRLYTAREINETFDRMEEGIRGMKMDLRDYFAAQAMSVLLDRCTNPYDFVNTSLFSTSYKIAGLMMEERKNQNG